MISDPFVFGQIAANHALADVYAMGARPHSALAVAVDALRQGTHDGRRPLPDAGRRAVGVAARRASRLIGGHSGEGAELALGLTVNGFAHPGALLRKGGFGPGDRLILTKPLGTGVIFAAAMRGQTSAAQIEAAIAMSLQSNAEAARILLAHGATAMTDVVRLRTRGPPGGDARSGGKTWSRRFGDGSNSRAGRGPVELFDRDSPVRCSRRTSINAGSFANLADGEPIPSFLCCSTRRRRAGFWPPCPKTARRTASPLCAPRDMTLRRSSAPC